MDDILIVVTATLLIGFISWVLVRIYKQIPPPTPSLQDRFIAFGNLQGKSRKEIENGVGAPNAVSAVGDNQVLCQWITPGYHIALLFTNDVCDGVNHECKV